MNFEIMSLFQQKYVQDIFINLYLFFRLFPGGSDGKVSAYNVGDLGLIPGLGLEKEMATHSSTLAWKILWKEEPGRLPSMRSQRVGHG